MKFAKGSRKYEGGEWDRYVGLYRDKFFAPAYVEFVLTKACKGTYRFRVGKLRLTFEWR